MINFFKIFYLYYVFLLILLPLSSCNENPLVGYRIEWDDYDPKLHGKIVHFKVPMRYVLLDQKHTKDYPKEVISIGRILETEEAVFEPGGDAKRGYLSQKVKDDMTFTIKGTYWYRRDWFNRELLGDRRHIVFVDENGIESVSLFTKLLYSDNAELEKLEEEGRFK